MDIAFRVIKKGEYQQDLAKEFRVTESRISQIVMKARKKPKLIAEILADEHDQ